jgi:hypothetical protein
MTDQNDHDILIELQTMMKLLVANQAESIKQHNELVARVSVLENKDSRDSERFKGIADEVRRSLNNSGRIETLTADVNNLGEGLRDLKSKSNLWDLTNALAAAIAAAIGWFR